MEIARLSRKSTTRFMMSLPASTKDSDRWAKGVNDMLRRRIESCLQASRIQSISPSLKISWPLVLHSKAKGNPKNSSVPQAAFADQTIHCDDDPIAIAKLRVAYGKKMKRGPIPIVIVANVNTECLGRVKIYKRGVSEEDEPQLVDDIHLNITDALVMEGDTLHSGSMIDGNNDSVLIHVHLRRTDPAHFKSSKRTFDLHENALPEALNKYKLA